MIQKPAAEYGIEIAVIGDVQHIVFDKFQIGQSDVFLDEIAALDIYIPDFDAQGIKSHSGEFHGVAAFQTA